jgi:hypothetical protein
MTLIPPWATGSPPPEPRKFLLGQAFAFSPETWLRLITPRHWPERLHRDAERPRAAEVHPVLGVCTVTP